MIRVFLLACLLLLCRSPAWAQECSGPMRLLVGLAAGGGFDAVARILAQRVTERFGHPIVVLNKAGASGNIAAAYVAKAPHDGCTIIIRGNEHNVNPLIYTRAGYEPKDFVSIVRVLRGPGLLVASASQPFKTLREMVEYAKANPGKLSYGSSGVGAPNHVFVEMFLRSASINLVHVPYKGAAPAMADTVGGVVQLSLSSVVAAQPFISSGKVIPLAITGPKRWPTLPTVPTLSEAGYPDATMEYWMGLFAPAGTPMPVIEKLNQEFRAVLNDESVKEWMLAQGYDPVGGSVQDFDKFLEKDRRVSGTLMRELKVRVD